MNFRVTFSERERERCTLILMREFIISRDVLSDRVR